ncbi:Lipase (class 3) [Rhizoctonia solani]|uniref:sn-1-specific diacylglycerol lipase n=1 Tax=Rhizoctonia solani TaxID=456999 RepID=A0A8H7II75_9AGAM|nr:Lipase (class 3) [Rhizoctonia solani]
MHRSQDDGQRDDTTPAWQRFSNMGLSAASVATSFGFTAVTRGTQLGFGIARGITSAVAYNSTALAENVILGEQIGVAKTVGRAINSAFGIAESVALAPIHLGHNIASTSLVAASSSLELLVWMFGTQEVGFSLAEFRTLIQREWSDPPGAETLPPERYGAASIARALVAWAALQDATREIQLEPSSDTDYEPLGEDFEIVITPPGAYVWGEPEELSPSPSSESTASSRSVTLLNETTLPPAPQGVVDWAHLRPILRQSDDPTKVQDATSSKNGQSISRIVQEAESEARVPPPRPAEPSRTWWGLITGRHDQEIFERFAEHGAEKVEGKANTATLGDASRLPRFWVLTDHGRRQIVLVLRGTYSLNELAITAELMGLPGRPVHAAIAKALGKNRGYDLVLTGHSLGAGVASLLSLMWADPSTGLTVRRSGLPSHRRVTAYCFGPPCIMSPELSKLAKSMVTSFVYSHDIVSTLSLGSVRDMQRAAAWLCVGSGDESCGSVLSKATRRKFGRQGEEEEAQATEKWANMNMADLFPPGRVLWALNDCDVSQQTTGNSNPVQPGVLRLFEVDEVETAFSQIVFSRDMLS